MRRVYQRKDIAGYRFTRLVAVSFVGMNASRSSLWLCNCDCGQTTITSVSRLLNRHTQSCGCLCKERNAQRKHGKCTTYLYKSWHGHLQNIRDANAGKHSCRSYKNMPIAPEWDNWVSGDSAFPSFEKHVIERLGARPSEKYTLDIIFHRLGFVPDNLRWATKKEQQANRRFLFGVSASELLSYVTNAELIQETRNRGL